MRNRRAGRSQPPDQPRGLLGITRAGEMVRFGGEVFGIVNDERRVGDGSRSHSRGRHCSESEDNEKESSTKTECLAVVAL